MKNNSSIEKKAAFFIVGAAKAGTTTLYNWLDAHPQVFMSPVKEPNYFASDINLSALRPQVKKRLAAQDLEGFISSGMKGNLHRAYITDYSQYEALFKHAGDRSVGEASASYLWSQVAAQNIKRYNPAAKIIVVLRDPAMRAWSHYLMDRKLGFTNLSFSEALLNDAREPVRSWGAASLYTDLGLYGKQLERYYAVFPREQILVLRHEDLKHQPLATLNRTCDFLSVNKMNHIPSGDANVAAVPKNRIAEKILAMDSLRVRLRELVKGTFIHTILKSFLFKSPRKSPQDIIAIQQLRKEFITDITLLEQLTQISFSAWK